MNHADQIYIEALVDRKLDKIAKTLVALFPEQKYTISKVFSDVDASAFDAFANVYSPNDDEIRSGFSYESPFENPKNIHSTDYHGRTPFGFQAPLSEGPLTITEELYASLKEETDIAVSAFDTVGMPTKQKSFTFSPEKSVLSQEEIDKIPSFIFGVTDQERAEIKRKEESGESTRELEELLDESQQLCNIMDRLEAEPQLTLAIIKEEMGDKWFNKYCAYQRKPKSSEIVPEVKPAKDPDLLHLQYVAGVISADEYEKLSGKQIDINSPGWFADPREEQKIVDEF